MAQMVLLSLAVWDTWPSWYFYDWRCGTHKPESTSIIRGVGHMAQMVLLSLEVWDTWPSWYFCPWRCGTHGPASTSIITGVGHITQGYFYH